MASSVEEFRRLLKLVEQHPELREELRRHVLTEELLQLPAAVHEQGTRLTRLEMAVAELVQAIRELTTTVQRHDARLEQVERELAELRNAVQELVATSKQHESRLARLEELSAEHNQRLARLEEIAARLEALLAEQNQRLTRLEEIAARQEALLAEHNQRLTRLEELSAQHAERLARLEEIAARQEERTAQLERSTQELRAAVAQLTEAVAQLVRKTAEHDRKLDRFSFLIGTYLERDAAQRIAHFFEAEGWSLLERPRTITVNGEFDVVARFARGDESVWVIIESKARIHPRDVEVFAAKLQKRSVQARLSAQGVQGTALAFMAGGNIERHVDDVCQRLGVGLIDLLGIAVHPRPVMLD
ncbi:Chromosome partition protein Smc [bacterium HR28]|nr:Chromosome partition protein Smc [bacterium HR28]